MTDVEDQLEALLSAVADPSQPKSSYGDVRNYLAEQLNRPVEDVYVSVVSKPGNFSVRADQSPASRRAKVFAGVLSSPAHLETTVEAMSKRIGPGRYEGTIAFVPTDKGWSTTLVTSSGSGVFTGLQQAMPSASVETVQPLFSGNGGTAPQPPPSPPLLPHATVPLVLDPRVKRMLRLSIASAKAVMVVGPPGTGKTTLLEEAIQEISDDPGSYGLSSAPDGVRQVTPEEAWTTRELVGGETVDDQGRLRFRPGFVLEAIRNNEWLFLDEANRADMDKIFGGLLTWLSDKAVVLGRAGPDLAAPTVRLEWGSAARSSVDGYERLTEGVGADPVRFVAGTDWRLIGTYNALDAQRVFRFGQALGRRFARVPVPPISLDDFEAALQPRLDDLPEPVDRAEVTRVIQGLYAAHLLTAPPLGPALFLAIPAYVARGLSLLEIGELAADSHQGGAEDVTVSDPVDTLSAAVGTHIAEGYLLGAGTWLAHLEPEELGAFRRRVVEDGKLLPETQWTFIQQLLPALA